MVYISRFFILLAFVAFINPSFGDNAGPGGNASLDGIRNGNNRDSSEYGSNSNGDSRNNNNNYIRSGKRSSSSGYFPLGSDLRNMPVKHGQSLNTEAN